MDSPNPFDSPQFVDSAPERPTVKKHYRLVVCMVLTLGTMVGVIGYTFCRIVCFEMGELGYTLEMYLLRQPSGLLVILAAVLLILRNNNLRIYFLCTWGICVAPIWAASFFLLLCVDFLQM